MTRYTLTWEGVKLKEKLEDEIQCSGGMPDVNMRRLWILDHLEGRTEPMTGPVMGPLFHMLIHNGFIEEVVPRKPQCAYYTLRRSQSFPRRQL